MTNDDYHQQQVISSDLLYRRPVSWHICMTTICRFYDFLLNFPDLQVFVKESIHTSIQNTRTNHSHWPKNKSASCMHTLIRLNQSVSKSNPQHIHKTTSHTQTNPSSFVYLLFCTRLWPLQNVCLCVRKYLRVYFCL